VKGYWIVLSSDITDQDARQTYATLWKPIAEQYGAKLRAPDIGSVLKEAESTTRVVIVEFPSYEQAKACYADPAYEEAKRYALKSAKRELLIVEGDLA
jgi:uncharacterized protein (DUF1330 family)